MGLKGSYHGDTIGAMDCCEPSSFNEGVDWYEGKGFWFDFPRVFMKNGEWVADVPKEMEGELGEGEKFGDLNEIFNIRTRIQSPAARKYTRLVKETIQKLVDQGRNFGALIIEPIILGAGGMLFV